MKGEPVIIVEDLSVDIQNVRGTVPVLHHIDLRIHAGEVHALVGPSGSGKSTLSALISGAVAKDQYTIRSGHIWWIQDGRKTDLIDLEWAERQTLTRGLIEVIFQEPATTLDPVVALGCQLVESGSGSLSADLVKDELVRLGLDPEFVWGRYPWQLSGGQQQRCLLARTMALRPTLILADEPTSALDKHREGQFLDDLVNVVRNDRDCGLLLISHNVQAVGRLADSISILHEGRLIAHGAATAVLENPPDALSRSLWPSDEPGTGFGKNLQANTILLKIKDMSAGYRPGVSVIRTAFVHIHQGEMVGIAGPSGSGKSSFFRAILDLLPWRTGEMNSDTGQLPGIQMVYQDPGRTMNPTLSIAETMEEWGRPHSASRNDVIDLLNEVGLSADMLDRMPHMFSGGQKQRLAIARALLCRPEVLLADEPFSSLDDHLQNQILQLLRSLATERGIGIFVVAHDVRKLERFCDRLILFDQGEVFWEGSPDEIAQSADPRVIELRLGSGQHPH